MKINSAYCVEKIIEKVIANSNSVIEQFEFSNYDEKERFIKEELPQTTMKKNWKRICKNKIRIGKPYTERIFDCKPFDDQLRAYVATTENDESIMSIVIQGE